MTVVEAFVSEVGGDGMNRGPVVPDGARSRSPTPSDLDISRTLIHVMDVVQNTDEP